MPPSTIALFALLLSALFSSHALASAGGAAFSLRPVKFDPDRPATQSYFIYDPSAGQQFEDSVRLLNSGSETGTVRLYPVDAATGRTSGVVYLSAEDARDQVGSWISLSESEITLAPGEERIVPFTVAVPADATPGQYVGGLVAEDVQLRETANEGALTIRMQNRTVVAVQLNVPGPLMEEMSITDVTTSVSHGYQFVQIGVHNSGNQMLKPLAEVTISDMQGQALHQLSAQLDTILPGNEIPYDMLVEGEALAEGQYQVGVKLSYGTDGIAAYQSTVVVSREQIATLYEAQGQSLPPLQQPEGSPATAEAAAGITLSKSMLLLIAGGVLVLLLGIVIAFAAGRKTVKVQ